MKVGQLAKFADALQFPRELRCLQPKVTALGLPGFVDDELIPNAHRQRPDYSVWWAVGGCDETETADKPKVLQLTDIEHCINLGLNVSWDDYEEACCRYAEAVHKPLIYLGSVRGWLATGADGVTGIRSLTDMFIEVLSRRVNPNIAGFVYDEAATYEMGTPEGALVNAAMAEWPNLQHWGEPRQTRGGMASVTPKFPALCNHDKWLSSGGSFGDNEHVSLAGLLAAGCDVSVIDTGASEEVHAALLRKGVGVALGTWSPQTAPRLKMLATSGTGGGGLGT